MQITSKETNYQNFKGLDYRKVLNKDKKFIVKNFQKLQELGKSYDIRMESVYATNPNFSSIDVYVMPLKKKLNFWQKLFAPAGISGFDSQSYNVDDGLVLATKDAIRHLEKWS